MIKISVEHPVFSEEGVDVVWLVSVIVCFSYAVAGFAMAATLFEERKWKVPEAIVASIVWPVFLSRNTWVILLNTVFFVPVGVWLLTKRYLRHKDAMIGKQPILPVAKARRDKS